MSQQTDPVPPPTESGWYAIEMDVEGASIFTMAFWESSCWDDDWINDNRKLIVAFVGPVEPKVIIRGEQ